MTVSRGTWVMFVAPSAIILASMRRVTFLRRWRDLVSDLDQVLADLPQPVGADIATQDRLGSLRRVLF